MIFDQVPREILQFFLQFRIGHHLRQAGIKKGAGYSALNLFQLIFCLLFYNKNWYRILQGKNSDMLPGKNAVYRFLQTPTHAWRRFLHSVSKHVIDKINPLTSVSRIKVFILDDSIYSRNRSKKVELLARIYDHASNKFIRGFYMLTLGWTDGCTFIPIDFSLLSSHKGSNRLCEQNEVDKRTNGFKRRQEALLEKPAAALKLLKNALQQGFSADYILMDSWFTHYPLVSSIYQMGLDVIGMIKPLKQRYLLNGQRYDLKGLYKQVKRKATNKRKAIIGSICVQAGDGLNIKIVFIRNRNKRNEWLAILSTDMSLTDEEIIRIYGMRWDIETFFKSSKSLLQLAKEFQIRSYDGLIAHTTIVFTRYIFLAWQSRCNNDHRTIGDLFYIMCDEVKDITWVESLQKLVTLFDNVVNCEKNIDLDFLKNQLQEWASYLPNSIKHSLAIPCWES